MLSIYENFTNNIQNSNNSQNEEDVRISIDKPINDTYSLHVELFNSNKSNESFVCKLLVMSNNKTVFSHGKIDIIITERISSINNSINNININFPDGIMHIEMAQSQINFDSNELTGLLEFSFNYKPLHMLRLL